MIWNVFPAAKISGHLEPAWLFWMTCLQSFVYAEEDFDTAMELQLHTRTHTRHTCQAEHMLQRSSCSKSVTS